jgi:hypothetical protein
MVLIFTETIRCDSIAQFNLFYLSELCGSKLLVPIKDARTLVCDNLGWPFIHSYNNEATFFSLLRAKGDPTTGSRQSSSQCSAFLYAWEGAHLHPFDLVQKKSVVIRDTKSRIFELNGPDSGFQPFMWQSILTLNFMACSRSQKDKEEHRPTRDSVHIHQVSP